MPTYEFSVVLKSPTPLTEDLADRLFEAGCDDATLSSSGGVVSIDFRRASNDLETAVCSAVANVQRSGCVVSCVEFDIGNPVSNKLSTTMSHTTFGMHLESEGVEASARNELTGGDRQVFSAVDSVIARIRRYAVEPKFSDDIRRRELTPKFDLPDSRILEEMITLIAFSQQVPAVRIVDMVNRGVLSQVFGSFSPTVISKVNPDDLRRKYWATEWLSPIRFPTKLDKMVSCAQGLLDIAGDHGSYMKFLKSCDFPLRVSCPEDVDAFWSAFEKARSSSPTFYRNFTSLCHLLQSLGFPCAKPDRIVLNVAEEFGVIPKRKQHSEADQRKVVRLMQSYAEYANLRVPVVDLMFLIHGGQTEARGFVSPNYYSDSA